MLQSLTINDMNTIFEIKGSLCTCTPCSETARKVSGSCDMELPFIQRKFYFGPAPQSQRSKYTGKNFMLEAEKIII